MKRGIIILGVLGLILIGGLYTKGKLYGPKHQFDKAKTEVNEFADNTVHSGRDVTCKL